MVFLILAVASTVLAFDVGMGGWMLRYPAVTGLARRKQTAVPA